MQFTNFKFQKLMLLKYTVCRKIKSNLIQQIWIYFYFSVADLKQGKILFDPQNIKANCTIIIKDEDFVSLASGTGKPQQVSSLRLIIIKFLF